MQSLFQRTSTLQTSCTSMLVRRFTTVASTSSATAAIRSNAALSPSSRFNLPLISSSSSSSSSISSLTSFSPRSFIRHNSTSSSSATRHAPLALSSIEFPYLKSSSSPSSTLDYSRGTGVHDAPLLIMHGLLGSAGNWRTSAPKLSTHRRILSIDLRNHGASPHSDDMTFPSCAEDIIKLMDEKGIEKAILLGHSLGAKVAMTAALLYPDRILAMIAVDMSPHDYALNDPAWKGVSQIVDACYNTPIEKMRARSEVDTHLKENIPNFTTRAFVLQNVASERQPDDTMKLSWRCNIPVFHRDMPLIAGFDLHRQNVAPYTEPALFIAGGDSSYVTPKQHGSIQQYFPNSKIVTIPGAGHWVHVDKTKEFIEVVREYLNKLAHTQQ